MPKSPALTPDQWSKKILTTTREAGRTGLPATKLGTAAQRKSPAFQATLDALLANGDLIAATKGKTTRYHHRDAPPPTPAELFTAAALAKINPGTLWTETALTGGGAAAPDRRATLRALANAGRLTRATVHTSARKSVPAYGVAPTSHQSEIRNPKFEIPPPPWSTIEASARAAAAARVDGAPSFEEVARRAATTPLVVQTAVLQALSLGTRLQLVAGDPREVSDPATAALHYDDRKFYRFRFAE